MQPNDPRLQQAIEYAKAQMARGASSGEVASIFRGSRYDERVIAQVMAAAVPPPPSPPAAVLTPEVKAAVSTPSMAPTPVVQQAAPSIPVAPSPAPVAVAPTITTPAPQPAATAPEAASVTPPPAYPAPVTSPAPALPVSQEPPQLSPQTSPPAPSLAPVPQPQPIAQPTTVPETQFSSPTAPTITPPTLSSLPSLEPVQTDSQFSSDFVPSSQPFSGQYQTSIADQTLPVQPQQPVAPVMFTPTPVAPTNYNIFQAAKDALAGVQQNLIPFIMVTLTTTLSSGVLAGILAFAFIAFIIGDTVALFASTEELITALIGGSTLLVIWYALAYAWATCGTGLALKDGLNGHTGELVSTLKATLKPLPTVIKTNLAYFLLAGFPYFLTSLIPILLGYIPQGPWSPYLGYLLPVLTAASIVWIIMVTLHYVLVSYIALFERHGSIQAIFRRSKELTTGGKMFIIQILAIVGLLVLAIAGLGGGFSAVTGAESPLTTIVAIAFKPVIDMLLVLYYRNRVIVKDGTLASSSIGEPSHAVTAPTAG